MASNTLIEAQITAAYASLKTARFDGDLEIIDAAERYLNRLLDRLERMVPV